MKDSKVKKLKKSNREQFSDSPDTLRINIITPPKKTMPDLRIPEETPVGGVDMVLNQLRCKNNENLNTFINLNIFPLVENIAKRIADQEMEVLDNAGNRVYVSENYLKSLAYKGSPMETSTFSLDFDDLVLLFKFSKFANNENPHKEEKIHKHDMDFIQDLETKLLIINEKMISVIENDWKRVDLLLDNEKYEGSLVEIKKLLSRIRGCEKTIKTIYSELNFLKKTGTIRNLENLRQITNRSLSVAKPYLLQKYGGDKKVIISNRVKKDSVVDIVPNKIELAIITLLDNIMKHSYLPGEKLSIAINSSTTPDYINLHIINDGMPMPGYAQNSFFREPGSITEDGFDLYCIAHNMEKIGGDVALMSNCDKTVFTLKLPRPSA